MLIGQKLTMVMSQSNPPRFLRHLGKDIPFREAVTFINRFSYFLQNYVQHKKRVGVYMNHHPSIYYSFFGLANTLNQMVPLNPQWSDAELAYAIDEVGVDVILTEEALQKKLATLVPITKKKPTLLPVDQKRCGEYDKTYKLPVGMSGSDKDIVLWLPSEGRTGPRKWVGYTHAMIETQLISLRFAYKLNTQDCFYAFQLHPLEPFALLQGGIIPILGGASVLLSDLNIVSELIPQLMEGKATRLLINPRHLAEFSQAVVDAKLKWPRLRSITPIKNEVSAESRQKTLAAFPEAKILQHYGCVEMGFGATMVSLDAATPEMALGIPLPGVTLRLLNAQGNEIKSGSGEIGEIVVSGKGVASGYLKAPGDDQKYAFRGTSFFTGDMGFQLKNGALVVVGKKNCMPQYQGQYVQTFEAEQKIRTLPGIADAMLLGVKNQMGKNIKLLVIHKSNSQELASPEIMKYCEANLPESARPTNVVIMSEVPLDYWGGVDRHQLAKQFAGAA